MGRHVFDRFTGVSWNRRSGQWQAYEKMPPSTAKKYIRTQIGMFEDEDEAAQAVDQWLKETVRHQA